MSTQRASVRISGRLVADPDIPANDKAPISFRVACNQSVKVNGTWEEVATFYRCKDWNRQRSEKLAKGCLVVVDGELTCDKRPTEKYGDDPGYFGPEIKVWNIDILLYAGNKPAEEGGVGAQGKKAATRNARQAEDFPFGK